MDLGRICAQMSGDERSPQAVSVPAEDPGAEARLRALGDDVERVGYVPADAAVG